MGAFSGIIISHFMVHKKKNEIPSKSLDDCTFCDAMEFFSSNFSLKISIRKVMTEKVHFYDFGTSMVQYYNKKK